LDIAAIIIFNTPFTTTTTNKYIVIHIDLNVRDEGADESQEQQMKYVPGLGLRVVLNKAVVAAANTIDKIKLTEDKRQAMRSAQKVTSILRSSDREKRYKTKHSMLSSASSLHYTSFRRRWHFAGFPVQ
jgi:hypothetical protein